MSPGFQRLPRAPALEAWVYGGAAVLGAIGLGVVVGSGSSLAAAAVLAMLGGALVVLCCRGLRRPLLAGLFCLAPVDLSKAVIAPLADRFFSAGPYYSPGLYLSLAHVVLLMLLPVWLVRRRLVQGRPIPFTRLDALAALFLAWIWIRSIGTPQGVLSLGTAVSYTLAVLAYWVVSHVIESRDDLRLALRASLVTFAITVLYVGAQVLTRSSLPLPGAKGLLSDALMALSASGPFRPPGFTNHPNSLAHYLVIVLAPAFGLLMLGGARLPRRVWWSALGVAIAGVGMLLLTLSRGGWVAAAASVLVLIVLGVRHGVVGPRRLAWLTVGALLAAAVVLLVFPGVWSRLTEPDGRSLESRGLLVDMAWTILRSHLWIGIGFGDFNRVAFQTSAPLYANVSPEYQFQLRQLIVHNHYLLLAAELGVPATLFFIGLLWRFARQAAPLRRWRDPLDLGLATGLAAGLVGQALFLTSDNYYADVRIFMLWLSAGLLQAWTRIVGTPEASRASASVSAEAWFGRRSMSRVVR